MRCKYIFLHPTGYWFKKVTRNGTTTQSVLTLCEDSDLKALPLSEVQDPKNIFVCTLRDGTPVYLINLKEEPKASQFAPLKSLNDCTWEVYHTLTCVETKIALVRLTKATNEDSAINNILICLATVEKIFGRGKGKQWATITETITEVKGNASLPTAGEKS